MVSLAQVSNVLSTKKWALSVSFQKNFDRVKKQNNITILDLWTGKYNSKKLLDLDTDLS